MPTVDRPHVSTSGIIQGTEPGWTVTSSTPVTVSFNPSTFTSTTSTSLPSTIIANSIFGTNTITRTGIVYTPNRYPPPEPHQAIAEADREQRREQATLERRQQQQQATRRARELLLRALDEEQREQFEREGNFHVHVDERIYLITKRRSQNVYLMEQENDVLVATEEYCIHPMMYVPLEDQMLAQKVLLEANEAAFLRGCNRYRLRSIGLDIQREQEERVA